ncbi:hypothetical protein BHE74_00051801 [Ensete ventricosum]|uniref:Uncharacterized protein n=1 Tax=Ensete ventricosum TaxID=4639 RepID=A0A444D7G4_ENSVE|nr:hypothetical protein B296_00050967 [Ensete ventricosum]RWV94038.1 hypothetical protein GW17_00043463 [Ensete ventricosum]RWW42628.1 hypothetical protein BHE74_00051801 [Ensete ventricosum]RZS19052.1 hypothetical protein BHM03_00051405 [Ensete ventricosum]
MPRSLCTHCTFESGISSLMEHLFDHLQILLRTHDNDASECVFISTTRFPDCILENLQLKLPIQGTFITSMVFLLHHQQLFRGIDACNFYDRLVVDVLLHGDVSDDSLSFNRVKYPEVDSSLQEEV